MFVCGTRRPNNGRQPARTAPPIVRSCTSRSCIWHAIRLCVDTCCCVRSPVCCSGWPAIAEAQVELEEAIALAVRNNPQLAGARIEAAIARTRISQAEGIRRLSSRFGRCVVHVARALRLGQSIIETAADDANGSLSISRALPWGGRVALTGAFDYARGQYISDSGSGPQASTTAAYTPPSRSRSPSRCCAGSGLSIARAPRQRYTFATHCRCPYVRRNRDGDRARPCRRVLGVRVLVERALDPPAVPRGSPSFSSKSSTRISKSASWLLPLLQKCSWQSRYGKMRNQLAEGSRRGTTRGSRKTDRALATTRRNASRAGLQVAMDSALVPHRTSGNLYLLALRAVLPAARIDEHLAENGILPQLDITGSAGPSGAASSATTSFKQLGTFASYQASAGLLLSTAIERTPSSVCAMGYACASAISRRGSRSSKGRCAPVCAGKWPRSRRRSSARQSLHALSMQPSSISSRSALDSCLAIAPTSTCFVGNPPWPRRSSARACAHRLRAGYAGVQALSGELLRARRRIRREHVMDIARPAQRTPLRRYLIRALIVGVIISTIIADAATTRRTYRRDEARWSSTPSSAARCAAKCGAPASSCPRTFAS